MIPINKKYEELFKDNNSNFSLVFSRMTNWLLKYKKDMEAIGVLKNSGNNVFCSKFLLKLLNKIHNKQQDILKSVSVGGSTIFQFEATLINPYVSGLASGHPTETGIVLDRNTGLPYIPASSLKGVLRLALAHILIEQDSEHKTIVLNKNNEFEIEDNCTLLRKYFGSTDPNNCERGELVILDAFPKRIPELKLDVMTPHYDEYYNSDKPSLPVETNNPNPHKFIAVKEGTTFIFRAFMNFKKKEDENATVLNIFKKALEELGLGAKTSVGYGMFGKIEDISVASNK